ncbi:orexin receptor type 2-like [Lycorma delicatula]|uniref:orexin receptor type 2-like n=1 Tax=Lycorma delicatula TaxID=130591 RepID=UPI003F515EF4
MKYNDASSILIILFYIPLFLTAASANTLVIIVVIKYHCMRSVTNYFLVNLSVADLLVTFICMPMAVAQTITGLWIYGEAMCKLTSYLQGVSVGASVFTISAMSIDRYLAVKQSFAFRKVFNRKSSLFVIASLWIVAGCIFAPILWVRQTTYLDAKPPVLKEAAQRHNIAWCIENWTHHTSSSFKHIYGLTCFIVVYFTPCCVIIFAYGLMGHRLCRVQPPFDTNIENRSSQQMRLVRDRRRVARLLVVLAILFAFCWLPYNILQLVFDLDLSYGAEAKMMRVFPFTLLLGHVNSAINPLLYCFMTKNFRKTIYNLLCSSHMMKGHCKNRSVTSSSSYASYHSPHRRCFVMSSAPRSTGGATRVQNTFL